MAASVSVMAETGVAAAAPDGVTATVYPGLPGQFLAAALRWRWMRPPTWSTRSMSAL